MKNEETCCEWSEVIARTKVRSDVCGEGSWGVLLECPSCNSYYLKNLIVSETLLPFEQERYDTLCDKYSGRLSREKLIERIQGMNGRIESSEL